MTTSRISPNVAAQLKAAIDASTDPMATAIMPPGHQPADDDSGSDAIRPHPHDHRKLSALTKTDRYSADQRTLLRWLGGVLAMACLGWGVWATQEIASLKTSSAVAQGRAEAIQAQLARIEAQLAEIQRDLRGHKP